MAGAFRHRKAITLSGLNPLQATGFINIAGVDQGPDYPQRQFQRLHSIVSRSMSFQVPAGQSISKRHIQHRSSSGSGSKIRTGTPRSPLAWRSVNTRVAITMTRPSDHHMGRADFLGLQIALEQDGHAVAVASAQERTDPRSRAAAPRLSKYTLCFSGVLDHGRNEFVVADPARRVVKPQRDAGQQQQKLQDRGSRPTTLRVRAQGLDRVTEFHAVAHSAAVVVGPP